MARQSLINSVQHASTDISTARTPIKILSFNEYKEIQEEQYAKLSGPVKTYTMTPEEIERLYPRAAGQGR